MSKDAPERVWRLERQNGSVIKICDDNEMLLTSHWRRTEYIPKDLITAKLKRLEEEWVERGGWGEGANMQEDCASELATLRKEIEG